MSELFLCAIFGGVMRKRWKYQDYMNIAPVVVPLSTRQKLPQHFNH
jgi:hypothetical protein